ncbi:MAG: PilW family protein [Gammaproteobacteria bacterium]|nr:PilW family protein [Gammaproteobacteria bacterium]MBU2678439.1 PilW family protein [Gammaproteobacteria bacterium]NNL52174.1 prepilin-type N-terminal cleavage/methylation domain-containing protein [Woeseiaceae bacterium]
MNSSFPKVARSQTGLTLTELMVALSIGSFLMIGAIQIYNQSREAFVVNESIARVQETAQFAMDTIEADLRMASNWGRNSRGLAVEGRSFIGDADPRGLTPPADCGARWVLDLGKPIDGNNNSYGLACLPTAAAGAWQPNSDVVTVRRASVAPVIPANGRLQIQSTRVQGEVFYNGEVPSGFTAPADPAFPATPTDPSATHNLLVNSYYVAQASELIPGVPTLRRKTLTIDSGASVIEDQEVAPGVENIQLQLGIDVDQDNTVDRYVNPGDPIYDPNAAAGYVPGARVITARLWMIVRGISPEMGVQDTNTYRPGDINLGTPNDSYRRLQLSKTILLRNSRT